MCPAGGPAPGAWLDRVMVYHQGEKGAAGALTIASVADAFAHGETTGGVTLRSGDLVYVRGESPGTGGLSAAGGGGGGGAVTPSGATSAASGGGGVTGMVLLEGVGHSGLYPIPDGADLYTAIALAGGPALGADLHHARVLSLQGDRRVAYEMDLDTTPNDAPRHQFLLRDGDVVELPVVTRGFLSRTWAGTRDVLTLSSSIASAYLLIYRLNH